MTKKEVLDFKPCRDLNRSATYDPSRWTITRIASDDALILPYREFGRMEFSEIIRVDDDGKHVVVCDHCLDQPLGGDLAALLGADCWFACYVGSGSN